MYSVLHSFVFQAMVSFPSNSHLQHFFPATFWCFSFFYIFIFNIFIITYASDSEISYNPHCSSIIPQVNTTSIIPQVNTTRYQGQVEFPYLQAGTGYLIGGNRLFRTRSSDASDFYFSFFPSSSILETTIFGVYRVEAQLRFELPYENFSYVGPHNSTSSGRKSRSFRQQRSRLSSSLIFVLNGFWSEPAGKLCMVGRAPWQSEEGKSIELEGVFKLNIAPKNSTIFTSLTKGSLESVSESNDPRYFEPIKIVYFPSLIGYDFKLESGCVGGEEIDQSQSISLEKGSLCSILWGQRYHVDLQYASDCEDRQNCSPFERDIAYLPQSLSLNLIQCFEEKEKVRILMKFSNWSKLYGEFDSRTTLLGEGSWDREKNQLCIVACKILHPIISPADAYVDDCSTRLSLRFPAIRTIKDNSEIAGEIWTNKTASDPGYFKSIRFSTSNHYSYNLPVQKYVYTQVGLVQHSCYANKPGKNGKKYPNAYSSDMRFDIFVEQSNERIAWGQAAPISVGDKLYQSNERIAWGQAAPISLGNKLYQSNSFVIVGSDEDTVMDELFEDVDYSNFSKPIKISYKISIYRIRLNDEMSSLNSSVNRFGFIDITAEGVYNPQTGVVCMVGCRELKSDTPKSNKESHDCEILVNIEFSPLYSSKDFGEGFIYTKRENTDPLYFEEFNITLASFNTVQAMRSIRRVNLEIIMALVSNTFYVLFLASQIFYVKKHPEKLPFVSILMLGILTLGHLIPLVLNFEALILKNRYQQNVILQATGWLAVKELSVRVVTLVAVLFLFRLLHLAWTSRLREENGNTFWKSELNAIFVSFLVYLFGALINSFVNLDNVMNTPTMVLSSTRKGSLIQEPPSSILKHFTSFTGLILDGYLFPQIIFNIFHNSRETALSPVFYMGTTLVRLLPHVYDLYRIHNYIHQDFGAVSYIYANHTADFYSIAWDVIIPCVCILFAVIVFLQQRFGGDFIVPDRYREVQLYEKVLVETNE